MRIYSILKRQRVYIAAFLLPILMMVVVYAILGIYPFGNRTLLTIDMSNEYVDYFSAFRDTFLGGESIFYSFSKLLGGNMAGLFAYYLASPFNFLFLFFSKENFDVAIFIMTLAKIGCCGLTMCVFLSKTFQNKNVLPVLFSVFYALMAYNIAYQLNIMWLDGVICLPMVILGIERIIERGKPLIFSVFLFLSIITNYYIGYMVCLFSILYFIYKLFLSRSFLSAGSRRKFLAQKFIMFASAGILSAGTSAVLLFPALVSLKTGKETLNLANLTFHENFNFIDIFSKMVLGAYSYPDVIHGLPNIFCGLMVVVLLGVYFYNSKITFREKVISAAFILLLLFTFYINTFNKIWHGFNPPAWFPYRYSFVFSFILILLAYKACMNIRGVRVRHIVYTCSIVFYILILIDKFQYPDTSFDKIAMTALFITVYSCVFVTVIRKGCGFNKVIICTLIPIVACEFILNSWLILRNFKSNDKDSFTNYVRQTDAVIQNIKANDKSFFRLEKTFTRTNSGGAPTFNDSLMFGYNGLSHYSSTDNRKVNFLMQCLGYKNNTNWAYYDRGSTLAADSLLNVKYVLSKNIMAGYQQAGFKNGIYVYKNSYALPLGFMVNPNIKNISVNIKNPFELQDNILSAMIGSNQKNCFNSLNTDSISLQNLKSEQVGGYTRYWKMNPHKDADITFNLTAINSDPIYAYFPTNTMNKVDLTLNERSFGSYFDTYSYGVLPLGSYSPGSKITLKMKFTKNYLDIADNQFYSLNLAEFSKDYQNLSQNSLKIISYSNTRVAAKVTVTGNKTMLFTSIPYDNGWTVKIDGKRAEKTMVFNTLIGISIPQGAHAVEFTYLPEGFTAGCVVSALSLLLILLLCIDKLIHKKHNT